MRRPIPFLCLAACWAASLTGAVTVNLQLQNSTPVEGGPGQKVVVVADAAVSAPLPVTVSRSSNDAIFSIDYILRGNWTIPTGERRASVLVDPVDDDDSDPGETITFTIQAGPNYTLGSSISVTVTIEDNDGPPPAAPSGLTTVDAGNDTINVSWTDNSTDEDGFHLYYAPHVTNAFSLLVETTNNVTSFAHTGQLALTNRYYLSSFNVFGETLGDTTNQVVVGATITAPSPPNGLLVTPTATDIITGSFTDNSDNEDTFTIYRAPAVGAFTAVLTNQVNETTFTNTGLTADTQYRYRVSASNESGESALSGQASARTHPATLAAPSALTTNTVTSTSIQLTWLDNSTQETGQQLDRSLDGAAFSLRSNLAANIVTYTDSALSSNTKYWYRVRATNSVFGIVSAWSPTLAAMTELQVPDAPEDVVLTATSQSALLLTWRASGTATSYGVRWGTDPASLPNTATVTTTSYAITGATPGRTYYAQVKATNGDGDSAWSSVVNAMTQGVISLSAAANGLAIALQWDALSGATLYHLERRDFSASTFYEVTTTTGTAITNSDSGLRLLIPLYSDPPSAFWTSALAAGSGVVGTIIFNPADGPAASVDADYTTVLNSAQSAGIDAIGYVGTDFGNIASATAKADIDLYYAQYPTQIDGIFLDEVPVFNDAGEHFSTAPFASIDAMFAYYNDLEDYITAKGGATVFNAPGTPTTYMSSRYGTEFATVVTVEDYESVYNDTSKVLRPSWWDSYSPAKLGLLVHTMTGSVNTAVERAKDLGFGFVYFTTDILPNPWDALDGNWTAQIDEAPELAEAKQYWYRVRAAFADGTYSAYSNIAAATTGTDTEPPPDPPPPDPPPDPDPGTDWIVPDDMTFAQALAGGTGAKIVQPGHQVMVRTGQTLNLGSSGVDVNISGLPGQPIRFYSQTWRGAAIIGADQPGRGNVLQINGSYLIFDGFDIYQNSTDRDSAVNGSVPIGTSLTTIVALFGDSIEFRHCYIHEGENAIFHNSAGQGNTLYGCIVMNQGWDAPDRPHGHGLYAQTPVNADPFTVEACHFLGGLGSNSQFYGSVNAPTDDILLKDNTYFGGTSDGDQVLVGGLPSRNRTDWEIDGCMFFNAQLRFGYQDSPNHWATLTDSTIYYDVADGNSAFTLVYLNELTFQRNKVYRVNAPWMTQVLEPGGTTYPDADVVVGSNQFYGGTSFQHYRGSKLPGSSFANWTSRMNAPTDTFAAATDLNQVTVVPSTKRAKFAMITIFNTGLSASVNIPAADVGRFLDSGDNWALYNTMNLEAGSLQSGTWVSGAIAVTMTGLSRTENIGTPKTGHSHPGAIFGTFAIEGSAP